MKYTSSLAVLALLGKVSASQVTSLQRIETPEGVVFVQRESDELANADKADDKEVQDVDDADDDIVSDTGFVNRFKFAQQKAQNMAQQKIKVKRESDGLANGDKADDKEVQDVNDADDDIVSDTGFVNRFKFAQKQAQQLAQHKAQMQMQRESDELANGDKADDKEVLEEWDVDDDIVEDSGFVHKWLQTGSDIRMLDDGDLANTVEVYKAHLKKDISKDSKGGVRTSDHIANGDHHEDQDLEDERDPRDDVVDENFYNSIKNKKKHLKRGANFVQLGNGYGVTHYSDELANGDSADNKDIHEDEDMNDDVVDINGATNAGYGSRNMEYFHAHNNIDESVGPGHFLTMQTRSNNMHKSKHHHQKAKRHHLAQVQGDPKKDDKPTKPKKEVWDAAQCVQNDGTGWSECPQKFDTVNFPDSFIAKKGIKQAFAQYDPSKTKEPEKIKPKDKEKEEKLKKGSDEWQAKMCEQNDGTGWAECPLKLGNVNEVDYYHHAWITDPDRVAYSQHSFAQKKHHHKRDRNMVQVADDDDEVADKNCGSVNWAECPGYFREQNNINAISGGHFGTDPKRNNKMRAKPLDDSFLQLQVEEEDSSFVAPGHWWKDIQNLSKNKKDLEESFVQLGEMETYNAGRYSNELANGDSADDRDIHEDEDMEDDVVDYMGQTNAGYGSRNMEWFHAHNTIDESAGPGHYLTDPSFIALKKSNNL